MSQFLSTTQPHPIVDFVPSSTTEVDDTFPIGLHHQKSNSMVDSIHNPETPSFPDNKTPKQQIYNALVEISKMGHFENGAAESGNIHGFSRHENALRYVFEKHGLTHTTKPTSCNKKNVDQWMKQPDTCPLAPGSFIEQPCGTHESPDFLLRVNHRWVLGIEAKSSKNAKPMYNSGGVKNEYLYIFCSKKYNQTTLYWGKDIITQEQQDTLVQLHALQKQIEILKNKLLEQQDTQGRGWSYYTRPMLQQSGAAEKTDYFIHRDRKKCEENVLACFQP